MIRAAAALLIVAGGAHAEPPALELRIVGPPLPAVAGPSCDPHDIPDAPARAIRLADGTVQLYAADQVNRVNTGPDLRHLVHGCAVVYRGAHDDDPAAYDDRSWIATPWTEDGQIVWAILHNEFHGHTRPALCPTGRYMDCWFNAITLAKSTDGGHRFGREPGLIAALPYRYDQVGLGHHGFFNPTNLVRTGGGLAMFAFTTRTDVQHPGNCLFQTDDITQPARWRAWNGESMIVRFADPYAAALEPAEHVCAPIAPASLRWPITSLVRHSSGQFVAMMQNTSRDGGVYYATSPDLLAWSDPVRLLVIAGLSGWTCGQADPIAYPSLLDPDSGDRDFDTVGGTAFLFATIFDASFCQPQRDRHLIRWSVRIMSVQ